MEEICNKNGRKFSLIVGCTVASERMPSCRETKAKMEGQERLKDQGERALMSPNLNCL